MLADMRRGLFGGTFDPPHLGHLVMADAALDQLDVADVAWVTAGDPWQKAGSTVAPADDRLQMTALAVDGMDGMLIDDSEVRRDGPTYTVDTLEAWQADGVTAVLVVGADAAAGIPGWHRAEAFDDVEIAVAPRPGTTHADVEAALGRTVIWLDTPELAISATDLRRRFAVGLSTRHLVPDPVRAYAISRQLYDR